MKKLSKDYKDRQKRIIIDRLKREQRNKRSKRQIIRSFTYQNNEIILAPKQLVLQKPQLTNECTAFIQRLSKSIPKKKTTCIDFSNTEIFTALAAVYLYSEIDRHNAAVVKIQNISSKQVRNTLGRSGLLKLCGHSDMDSDGYPITRGIDDDDLPEIIQYLMTTASLYNQLNPKNSPQAERLVSKAISEAMLNVSQHAYPGTDKNSRFRWIIADIIDSNLHIALCDRGVGIPKTLFNKSWFKEIAWTGIGDAKAIRKAMQYTRTQSRRHGSGLGSKDIQELILEGKGELIIISGKGYYCLKGSNKKEKTYRISYDIKGTLIQWRIRIAEKENE